VNRFASTAGFYHFMGNQEKITEFLERGVERVYPSKEFLKERLESGQKLTMYLGIDPTGSYLHLGHAIPLLKLKIFQELGHRAILLIGDFTGMIGDPTDKTATRKKLTRKEVSYNARLYKNQTSRFLKFGGKNPARILHNSKWLSKLSLADTLEISSNITYAQTIKRDMFQKRIAEGRDLYLHELMYPMMQGYDSVVMNVDGEIGGNDQTFNMLMGRDLLKKLKDKEKFVITMKLLADTEGKKMGKTENNMVSFNEKPETMFGKIMSWSDNLIVPGFELLTEVPMAEIIRVKTDLISGTNPRDSKLKLAEAIVAFYHGNNKAKLAQKSFLATFSQGKTPSDIKEVKVAVGTLLSECLIGAGIIASKSEWRRLVGENAVSVIVSDGKATKIVDFNFKVETTAVFKIGKHRFLKIVL